MRTETEMLTRAYLRRRREERKRQRVNDRLIGISCLLGAAACMAFLVYLEWSALIAAFAAK